MENDFVVLLNELPIECNKKYIQSNFQQLYRSPTPNSDFLLTSNQRSIQIDGGNDYYEITKDIFQGNDYEISSENFSYLKELSRKIQSNSLQTKLNSFLYNRECNDHQVDHHPSIQFLVELSTLIHQISLSNYEDISSQIKQKLIPHNINQIPIQEKGKKSKKKKGKKNQKRKKDTIEEEEINEESNEEKNICLKNISKKSLSKLFYYEIVNSLLASFHTIEELQDHQNKVDVVVQLIKELDSSSEEEDEESETYLNNFINYVIKKYSKVKNQSSTISNYLQETFYIINFLISNELLTLENLQNEKEKNTNWHKFSCPEYFLHFYPQNMITKYFRNHSELLTDENNQPDQSSKKKRKSKKGNQQKNDSNNDQIQEYIQNHQQKIKEGFSFDDDFLNIIINDNLKEFKSYIQKKVDEKKIINRRERKREKVDDTMIINEYVVPNEISKFSCFSALNNCTIIELSAFFGSRNIFTYLNSKKSIRKSPRLLSYLIAGKDSRIIKMYLDTLSKCNDGNQTVEDNGEAIEEQQNDSIDYYSDEDEDRFDFPNKFNNSAINDDEDKQNADDGYIVEDKNAFNSFNQFYYDGDNEDLQKETKMDKEELDTKLVINTITKMMSICVDYGNLDLYMFLYNYLLQYKEQEINKNSNYLTLDGYMKKCISRGYFDIVPELLKEGSTADVLLNLFSKSKNEIGVEYMLEYSYIDVNKPYRNKTPLEYCIDNKDERSSILLLKTDKVKLQNENDPTKETIIHTSCRFGLSKVVEYLLQKNLFDVNEKTVEGIRPIHLACQSGDFDTVQVIIQEKKKEVKINGKVTKGEYKGFTPLHFACLSGNPQIVTLLIDDRKADVNLKDGNKKWTPLQYAVLNGHSEVVSLLLDKTGIETDMETKEKETLLHLGCMSNNAEVVDLLLNSPSISTKFDLNARTSNERTPLQIALSHGNINMISVLLNIDITKKKKGKQEQSEIDPNMLTSNGQAPLILACEMRRPDICSLLLKHNNIDVNIQLSTGKSALYVACELNLIDTVKELLSWRNIDVNAETKIKKTPLIVACEKGNKEIVEILINYNDEKKSSKKGRKTQNNSIDFNAKTVDGKSALLISCEYLRLDIAEMLVNIDEIECDDASDDGKTPLCYACEKGSEYLASELINHNADVNHHTKDNKTPLYFACLSRNSKIIQNIINKIDDNSQINLIETTNGTSPLFITCQNGDLDSYNLLNNEIDNNSNIDYRDKSGRTPLYAACEGENTEIVESLLTKFNANSDIADKEGKTPLHVACEKKNTELVFLLLNHSSNDLNINKKWNDATPLEIACEKGSIEIVQLLLKQEGIQVNPTDKKEVPPLLCACEIWRTDIIKLLLTEVPDINVDVPHSDGRTALHYACEKGDVEISDIILSKSIDSISLRTTDKKTPIELACQNENVEIIRLLLKYVSEMQINAKFFDGNTILTKACIQQSVDVVKLLLESTVIDVNAANKNEKTALFIVARNGNEQICQMLLNHEKIDLSITRYDKTVLYEACKYGNADIAELLIKKGAKADCVTKNGKTPLHVACQHGFNNVVSLLLNCPEVDVNKLTYASPEQIKNKYFKTFYAPIHLACGNKNHYSHHVRTHNNPSHFHGRFYGSNSNENNYDDFDYEFNRKRLELGNHQLCVELLVYHPNVDINIRTSKNETALTIACQSQKFEIIKTLLQSPKIDPNVSGSFDSTPLQIACQRGKINIVQMLLNIPQTDVNRANNQDQTPLSTACSQNRNDIVQLLLNREDLKICNRFQENPIRNAIQKNNIELFNILLHHPSFDVNFYDKNTVTPLGYAIESQNINFVNQLLFISGIDVNKKSNIDALNMNGGRRGFYYNNRNSGTKTLSTPLSMALTINNYQIVKMLIQYQTLDINEYACGKTALHTSIINDNNKITTLLLSSSKIDPNLITVFDDSSIKLLQKYDSSQKIDPFLFGQSSLHIACLKHNLDAVNELIKKEDLLVNEYTNAADLSCLDKVKRNLYNIYINSKNFYGNVPSIEDMKLSVSFSDNPYRNNCNALYIACAENQPEIVSSLLLRDDIDLNAKSTPQELTPLHIAAKLGFIKVVDVLLSDERCDPHAVSRDGTNVLAFACQSHNIELMKNILSKYGDDLINSTAENGDTLFHYACRSNDAEIFEVLINGVDKNSFDINNKNYNGNTLLHMAVAFDVPDDLYRKHKKKLFTSSSQNDDDDNDNNFEYIDDYKTKTVFGLLIENGADVNAVDEKGQTPLFVACQNQCFNNINILLSQPEIIFDDSNARTSPFNELLITSINKNYKIEQTNRYRRFDFDMNEQVKPTMTIPKGLIRSVCKFLDKGVNFNNFDPNNGLSLLHFAIICKSGKLASFFFDKTDEIDVKTIINYNSTYGKPIDLAIDNWDENVMCLLAQRIHMINITSKAKQEIIYNCATHSDAKTMMTLLTQEEKGGIEFNVNYIDSNKKTPLHIAVDNGNSIAASILANYEKVDLTLLDKDGKAAIHYACMNQSNNRSMHYNNNYNNNNNHKSLSQFTALAILTKVDLHEIQQMYEDDPSFTCDKFNKYLLSQQNSLNERIDINIPTKGMTRREFFRRERQKILARNPQTKRFHIWYNEPQFNIGFTPLHISVFNQQINVVKKILLFKSLDINAVSNHGDTAITMAAKNWNEQIVRILINYPGSSLNFVPKQEEEDDEYDDYGNHKDKEEQNKVDPNRPDHTFTSEELYEIKQKKKNQNRTLLHAACQNNCLDIVKLLLKMSEDGIFDINCVDSFDEMAPLHYICENGNEEIFNLFVDFEKRHPNVIDWNIRNKNGMTPLHFAARGRQTKIVDELINNEIICPHVDINAIATGEFENGRTPISFACEKGLIDIVKLLLNDKNEDDENDPFALLSLNKDQKKKVKRGSLCGAKSECDLTIKSKGAHQKGMTALHYACKSSNIEVVKLILNHGGFDINARANGKSCLFLACKHNRIDIVRLLLQQNDINYNIKTPRGVTPLMIAAQEGRKEIVEMLLKQRRIDKNALTANGQSAKSMAKNTAITELFEKYA